MSINDFRDLDVYQHSQRMLPVVDKLCNKIKNQYRELSHNLMKTACQIAPQIAEGYAKKSSSDEFRRYLTMAIGSTDEMIAHLEQVKLLVKSVNHDSVDRLIAEYEVIVKRLQTLKRVWN